MVLAGMKMVLLFASLLALPIERESINGDFSDEEHRFSFTIPSGFALDHDLTSHYNIHFVDTDTDKALQVFITFPFAASGGLDGFTARLRALLLSRGAMEGGDIESTTLGGEPARAFDMFTDGESAKHMRYLTVYHRSRAYVFAFVAQDGDVTITSDIDMVSQSLRFL